MNEPLPDGAATTPDPRYRTLLAVSQAITTHRDLPALFHDLADRLHQVVPFDDLILILHDAATNTMRPHVLETSLPERNVLPPSYPLEEGPSGWVWQHQQPLIVADLAAETRWQWLRRQLKRVVNSVCGLPLTTARSRLGVLVFASAAAGTYHSADLGFLRQVASQVAVAVENALAFEQIECLTRKLEQEKSYLEEEIRTANNFEEIVGESPTLRRVLDEVATVAVTPATVLIRGETGTGKELIARAIHQQSPRRERTFVKLNCAAIPTGLLESELFGHEKGAFTGAVAQKVGRFQLADEGTLFLDEVGDIPLELQSKLLRVLQEQEFERLGGTQTIRVDVRLVAATNRDLARMIASGQYRSDLYYRLNVFPVQLPPLRERRDDVPRLAWHFTRKFARRMGRSVDTITAETLAALRRYDWPGNVRELENVIERAVILSPGHTLQVPLHDLQNPVASAAAPETTPADAAATLEDAEREHILRVLLETNWVVRGPDGAAARLGLKRSTLYWKMKKLGIARPN
jgi:formate hydrogenlyase transcriptional activator